MANIHSTRGPISLEVSGCCQVTTTLPDQAAANQLGATLVAERLAACSQVVGPIASTYWWEGRIERSAEWYCHLKTTLARLPQLQKRVRELHPYQLPELVALPVIDGDQGYLRWIVESVGGELRPIAEPSEPGRVVR